jgi:hypothetical protein
MPTVKEVKQRCAEILALGGNRALAEHLAFRTKFSVAQAKLCLQADAIDTSHSPKAKDTLYELGVAAAKQAKAEGFIDHSRR